MADGNLKWKNGETSSFNNVDLCPCKFTLDMLSMKTGRTWKTADPTRKTT